ncbi:MAG: hypothetical protein AAF466_11525 [Bacteroidota bacterium]
MPQPHIELKQRRDIGDTITTFFDFFKVHLKPYTNIFIRYNGIFILGFLGVSYLMVTGFAGSMRTTEFNTFTEDSANDFYIGIGFFGFAILYIITAIMNYSLAASYIANYQKNPEKLIDKKPVWDLVWKHLGKIILFIILMVLLVIPMAIISLIVGFIPVVGFFAQIFVRLGYTAWMGISFMSIFDEGREVTDALGEGWRLLTKFFWKSILVNFVIGFLMFVLMMVLLMIPGFLIGIYAYFSLESGVDLAESPIATVIWTISLCLLLVLYTFIQSVTQMGNGVLYYSLHEETYNLQARQRIDQIGVRE